MIKKKIEKDYNFKHPFGNIKVDSVAVGISDSGRRILSADEIARLTRLAGLNFFEKNYAKSLDSSSFILSAEVFRAIMILLDVNQVEFAKLIGCQKSKVSKILKGDQDVSKSQTLLAMERLGLELARPGANRALLHTPDAKVSEPNKDVVRKIDIARFKGAA